MLHKISVAVVVAAFLMGSTAPLQAATCAQRIQRAERKLEQAIQRHGLHSVQAERRRDQLERARARCRY